jgi:hypothetical protein
MSWIDPWTGVSKQSSRTIEILGGLGILAIIAGLITLVFVSNPFVWCVGLDLSGIVFIGFAATYQSRLKKRWRQRVSAGLCARCGYDIRASKDRCPECGASIFGDFSDRS